MIRNAGDRGCKYLVFCAIISLKKYGSFLQKYYQRLAAVHRLYSERKGDRYEYDSGYYCTGTGDRIWRICGQLSLFKKETGAQLCRLCR